MSEEEDSFLNVKRSLKKRMVKHSTPVDSMLSKTTPSLTDLTTIKHQNDSKRVYGSPVIKSNLSRSLSQISLVRVEAYIPHVSSSPRRLSKLFDSSQELNKEISQSSRVLFSRRRLSTVLGSEESNEEPSDKVVPSVETQVIKASEETAVTPKSGPSGLLTGIPGIKDFPIVKARKKKTDKALVRKKQREWLLRLLENIESATEHELTIEEA